MTAPCPAVAPNGARCSGVAEHAESWHADAEGVFQWQDDAR